MNRYGTVPIVYCAMHNVDHGFVISVAIGYLL